MQPAIARSAEFTRHACEPCRKKKSKCPGEKPTCSFCQRLKANCVYLPRKPNPTRGNGRTKAWKRHGVFKQTAPPRAREELQLTQLQIGERRRSLEESPSFHGEIETQTNDSITSAQDGIPGAQSWERITIEPESRGTATLEPPREVLEFFVNEYQTKLHFQPLPLLRLENLTDRLLTGPRFLLWSFLSLTFTLTDHEFYEDTNSNAKELVTRAAEDAVMRLAFEGIPNPAVIQSLCLIALKHIRTYQPARALMAVGAASRLFMLRNLSMNGNSPLQGDDCISRAYWSIFVFESLFSPSMPGLSVPKPPAYPDTDIQPPLPTPTVISDDLQTRVSNQKFSITGSCIRIISTWGNLRSYLHRLHQAEVEKPWLPSSTHTKLSLELLEFESQYNRKHLLNNVGFATRTVLETSQQRDYWNPWMTTQIVWHAAQAILNHPFLHLVVLRSQDEIPQSCLFLQQKVEMAQYHAGWLFRIIRMGSSIMDVVDPMLGVAVAATATAQWLFQFSKDLRVARRAQEDLSWCDEFLRNMSLTWPHFSHSLIVLRKLQDLADQNRRDVTDQDTTIKFKSAWFWELIDTKIWQSSPNDLSQSYVAGGMKDDVDASMCLKSHFIDPFREDQDAIQEQQCLASGIDPVDSIFLGAEGLEQFHIDELSFNFLNSSFEM